MLICDNCTGCGACYNVCPHKAIKMEANSEGFLYPKIDEGICVNCNLCKRVCPVNYPDYKNEKDPDCFAAMASDDLRADSSSGAVFPVLASQILADGGYICGAAYSEDMQSVEHVIIGSVEELRKLKGSKYLQSNTKDCYRQIKKFLSEGKKVLFSGTPCQVAGLKGFLQKNYENLICVDIICHGTPSPKVYRKYIKELELPGKLTQVNFRDKINGWSSTLTTTIKTTETQYSCPAKDDIFMQVFLQNYCLRKSCGNCPFNKIPRQGDLTIGDFWRIDSCNPAYNDKKGTSAVLVNTAKGKSLLDIVQKRFKLLKKVNLRYAINGNKTLIASSPIHNARDTFFANLDNMSLKDNLEICKQDKVDIVILNFWWSVNYGAILTAYALQQSLESLGYTNRLVHYVQRWCRDKYKGSFAEQFAQKYLKTTDILNSASELPKLNKQAETFIVGSDQVFRQKYNCWEGNYFYLPFVEANKKKIACAASFGLDVLEESDTDKFLFSQFLSRFDAVSVRENSGIKICKDDLECDAVQIMDPVFWLSADQWKNLLQKVERKDKGFGLTYVLDKHPETVEIVRNVCEKFATDTVLDMENIQKRGGEGISPEEWLYNIQNCSYLVTDSFHGVCFAIIFNKPFVCIANKERGVSRFECLFEMLGLSSHLLFNDEFLNNRSDVFDPIDYNTVNQKLEKEVNRSKQWLKAALAAPKKKTAKDSENLLYMLRLIERKNFEIAKLEQRITVMGKIMQKNGALKPYKWRYWRYKVLSMITFGKTRKKYKAKRKEYKRKIKELKKMLKG